MSNDYMSMVAVPAKTDINSGLSPCHQATMLHLFGKPGNLTDDCSEVTNAKLKAQIVTHAFNNFSVTGWEPAIEDLKIILTNIYNDDKALHALIGTAGMLCCRKVRVAGSHSFSNHSWGDAIDLTIGGVLSDQETPTIPKALLMIYPYFHKQGWYWGMGFPKSDPMHFEPSDERIRVLFAQKNGSGVHWGA